MKLLVENYTFDASTNQVTLTDYNPVVIERLLMITNVVDNTIIYQFNNPILGGTASTNVITLTYNTSSMADTDELQIFYDDADTPMPISGSITAIVDTSLLATSAKQLPDGHSVALSATDNAVLDDIALNQTDASQKTQVVDGTGNVIGSTSNALDVNIKSGSLTTTEVTQDTATSLKTQAEVYQGGAAVAVGNPLEVTLPTSQVTTLTPPAAITGFATSAKQDTQNASINTLLKPASTLSAVTTLGTITNVVHVDDNGGALTVDGTVTANLSAIDNAVLDVIAAKDFATQATLSALNAKLVSGTAIGDVTINNSSGAAAVNIQDGGNSITVDGTVAVSGTVPVSGTFYQATQPVSLASAPTTPISNADITSCKTALELLDNSVDGNYLNTNMNVAGSDVAGNNGTASAQTLRVTLASDSTGQVKLAAGTANIGIVGHNIMGIGHGVKTVTTAGTDVALAASTACKRVTIQAQTDNSSSIAIGGPGVDATISTGTGILLEPGDVFELEIDNLADVYVDALISGDGCRFTYFT